MKEPDIFETTNLDLASFLVMEGVKLLERKIVDRKKKIVVLRFLDSQQNCLDLEHIFYKSDFKKYRDINKLLLKKIHETIKES